MMDIKNLMSGIAVVIDDALKEDGADDGGRILQITDAIRNEWAITFYKTHEIPSAEICRNLLKSASFILLDWKLWPNGAATLEAAGIENNIQFLGQAKDYFVPVFIFTNESPADIINAISPHGLYDNQNPGKNFIFIERKKSLTGNKLFNSIKRWVNGNASVYTLKAWEQAFHEAKKDVFGSMYGKSPSWPRVFWSSYKEDGADPSFSLVTLINNNLLARMETDIFEKSVLGKRPYRIDGEDIKPVLEGASFIPEEKLPENNVKAGDLFKKSENAGNYLLNVRADCDCIPRQGKTIDSVELYCIEGKSMNPKQVKESFMKKYGTFNEQVNQAILFGIHDGKTIQFNFGKLVSKKFHEVKNKRVGRITHPYITRIQQRYALYLQRQGLPRIPEKAIRDVSEAN